MDPIRKKALGRSTPKLGKGKGASRTESFLKRQRKSRRIEILVMLILAPGDKTWLETHLWHAKRMHMENLWGYRLVGDQHPPDFVVCD